MATQNKMLFISGLQSQLWRWYWWCRWWWCEQNRNARGEGGIEAKTVDIREARLLRGDMMAMAPWTCGLWHNMMMMTVSKDQKVVVVHVNTSLLSLLSKHVIPHSASESSKISEKHFFFPKCSLPSALLEPGATQIKVTLHPQPVWRKWFWGPSFRNGALSL